MRRLLATTTLSQARAERATFNDYLHRSALPETTRLQKTIDAWWPEIETFITTRVTSAKTEAANVTIKNIKRAGRGYRSHTNYKCRIMLYNAGRWQRDHPTNPQSSRGESKTPHRRRAPCRAALRRGYHHGMASEQSSPPTEVSVRELVMDLAVTGGYDGPQPNQDELLASIGIDSLLTIELVVRLEDHFGIEVPDELLTPTSFATLGSVAALVKHLQ